MRGLSGWVFYDIRVWYDSVREQTQSTHSGTWLCTLLFLNNLTRTFAVWTAHICVCPHITAARTPVFKSYYWQMAVTWPHIILNRLKYTRRTTSATFLLRAQINSATASLNCMHGCDECRASAMDAARTQINRNHQQNTDSKQPLSWSSSLFYSMP